MVELLNDDEFVQFLLKKCFIDSKMDDEDKLKYICSSVKAFQSSQETKS